MKKLLSIVLALAMLLTLTTVAASAETAEEGTWKVAILTGTTINNRSLNSPTVNQLLVVIDFRVANHTDINTQSRHRQNRIIEGFTLIY